MRRRRPAAPPRRAPAGRQAITLRAARRVVAAAARRALRLGHRVGAVERVVEAAPAGVGRIERIAGVGHGNDELRAGDAARSPGRPWPVPIAKCAGSRPQVADLAQERLVGGLRRSACRDARGASASILRCSASRWASSAAFFGARSRTRAARPDQNASAPTPRVAPMILAAPEAVLTGRTMTIGVKVAAVPQASFQWLDNGTPIRGATAPTITRTGRKAVGRCSLLRQGVERVGVNHERACKALFVTLRAEAGNGFIDGFIDGRRLHRRD